MRGQDSRWKKIKSKQNFPYTKIKKRGVLTFPDDANTHKKGKKNKMKKHKLIHRQEVYKFLLATRT